MASLHQKTRTRWYLLDRADRREVKPNTPGAVKVTEAGGPYYIVYREGGRLKWLPTGLTKKRAAQQALAQWEEARELGTVGLVNPHKQHLDRAVREHVDDYLATLPGDRHRGEVGRVLAKLVAHAKAVTLRDLTAAAVNAYLAGMTAGVKTRIKHRAYVSGLCNWLHEQDRVGDKIIDKVPTPKVRAGEGERVRRRRRAYTVDELRRLLRAALDYPTHAHGTNTGGRPRKDGTPARSRWEATLTPAYCQRLEREGRERWLTYRLMLSTGLRRGEMSRVRVSMFNAGRGVLRLPVGVLKHKPDGVDALIIPLPSPLAADLAAHATGRQPTDKLLAVPDARSMIRQHRRRLTLAGIDYQTDKGHVDVHALRRTLNMILKRKGVPLGERQVAMRHAAGDLTTRRYDDDHADPVTQTRRVRRLVARLDSHLTAAPK